MLCGYLHFIWLICNVGYSLLVLQICLISVIAVTFAAPQNKPIAIVRQESEGPNPDGSYKFRYSLS